MGAFERQSDLDGDGLSDNFEIANSVPASAVGLDPMQDNDADGLTAMEEFAYGLSDLRGDYHNTPSGTILRLNNLDYLAISYPQNPQAQAYLQVDVLRSSDHGINDSWDIGETVISDRTFSADGNALVTERSLTPMQGQMREFLKILVTKR